MSRGARASFGRRIVIIGGGVTGLSAAFELERILTGAAAGTAAGSTGSSPGAPGASSPAGAIPPPVDLEVVLLEASGELGGKVRTERHGGFLLESGPDGFLTRKTAAMELCSQLDLTPTLIGRKPPRQGASVRRGSLLYPLPEGLSGLVPADLAALERSPLLSGAGRVRALREPDIPPRSRTDADDESVAAFMTRRFGREAFDLLIEPLVTGIFAADADSLSVLATYPRLREVELRHGSLVRGLSAGAARAENRATGSPIDPRPAGAGPLPPFLSPRFGMGEIPRALAAALARTRIRLNTRVESLKRCEGGFRLEIEGGERLEADVVIIATPAYAAAALVDGIDGTLAGALGAIPFASTAIVHLAYPLPRPSESKRAVPPAAAAGDTAQGSREGSDRLSAGTVSAEDALRGHGYLIPAIEASPFLACTLSSEKWEGRAPEGMLLVRLYAGRAGRDPLPSDALLREARAELSRTLGLTGAPIVSTVVRRDRAMPQYTLGHLDRLADIDSALARLSAEGSALLLAGASYRGVGVPDCIQSGREAALRALAAVRGPAESDSAPAQARSAGNRPSAEPAPHLDRTQGG